MLANSFNVDAKNVEKKGSEIFSTYSYESSKVVSNENGITIVPYTKTIQFKTETKIPKLGVMIVGWGGNNGTTVTNGILANRLSLKWETKRGEIKANYNGSLTQCSTTYLGQDDKGTTYVAPFKSLVPMVEPNDIVIGGWDISKMNIYEATKRAKVLEPTMYMQLREELEKMVPLPGVFDLSFVAPNQETRADNVIEGNKESN
jgi:myo-inositol-1-phosphate synthase